MDKTTGCQLLPGCPDIECLEPFVLQRAEGQCCPTCEAPVRGLHPCHQLPPLDVKESNVSSQCAKLEN